MRNKDTGEFELVVGDKQLLSGFFIGVLLLAVVFAMGYVLGRGTPKSPGVQETAAIPSTDVHPAQVPAANPGSGTPPANPPVMDVGHPDEAAAQPAEEKPQPTTVPAKEATAPEPPAPAPKEQPASSAATSANSSYWQVLAGSQGSAEAMVQTLKHQGFPATTQPGRNNLTVVWVGPYSDKESLSKAKKQLQDAGFTNLFKKP